MNSGFRFFTLNSKEPFKIGRKQDSNLVLNDYYVSREHAWIRYTEKGWLFENKSESSGSFCNGQKVERKILEDNDLLLLGTERLCVSLRGGSLTLLHICAGEDLPIPLQQNIKTLIGRKVGEFKNSETQKSLEMGIEHPGCPRKLATVKLLTQDKFCQKKSQEIGQETAQNDVPFPKMEIRFFKKVKVANQKTKKVFVLQNGDTLKLPWCSFDFRNGLLFLHQDRPGFSVKVQNLNSFAPRVFLKPQKELLKDINFFLPTGEIMAVIGKSGQGKSSLLHSILGNLQIAENSKILLNEVSHVDTEIQKYVAFLPQEPELRKDLTVYETLQHAAEFLLPQDTEPTEIQKRIYDFSELLSIQHLYSTPVAALSGGEKRRAALAAELIASPGLILLDEPLSGLDPQNRKILCNHLRRLSLLGYTVILTTHDYEALEMAHKILVLHHGGEAFFGTPEETFHFFDSTSPAELLQKLNEQSVSLWENSTYRNRLFLNSNSASSLNSDNDSAGFETAFTDTPNLRISRAEKNTLYFPKIPKRSAFLQILKILFLQTKRDKGRLAALLFEPMIIGFLFSQIFSSDSSLWTAAFALILSAEWFALSIAVRGIVQEKQILAAEFRKGFSIWGTLSAETLFFVSLSFLQTGICYLFLHAVLSISFQPLFLAAILLTTMFPAVLLGLLVSAFSKNESQANALLPLLIIPQVALSGALIPIDQMTSIGRFFSYLMPVHYNWNALKNLFLNESVPLETGVVPILLTFLFYIITGFVLHHRKREK